MQIGEHVAICGHSALSVFGDAFVRPLQEALYISVMNAA